ncbi:MAG: ATP-binding cassette domain-containing protein [Limnochordales bacterium]
MEGRSGSDHPAEVRPAGIRVQNLWKVFAPKGVKVDVHDPDRIAWAERSGAVVAVRDVSFEVKPGELFVVMGLSGSGKSTLIRCLLRLVEPTAGTIVCNGHDVTAMNARIGSASTVADRSGWAIAHDFGAISPTTRCTNVTTTSDSTNDTTVAHGAPSPPNSGCSSSSTAGLPTAPSPTVHSVMPSCEPARSIDSSRAERSAALADALVAAASSSR